MRDIIFILLPDRADIRLIPDETDAIEASKQYPKLRVGIFEKEEARGLYSPTYKYYKNGVLVTSNTKKMRDTIIHLSLF